MSPIPAEDGPTSKSKLQVTYFATANRAGNARVDEAEFNANLVGLGKQESWYGPIYSIFIVLRTV